MQRILKKFNGSPTKAGLRLLLFLGVYLLVNSNIAFASAKLDTKNLNSVFDTVAFQGNWAFFGNLNIVGFIMQLAISVLSLIAMCFNILTVLVSIVYLSNKNIFNTVHDIKSNSLGASKALGFDNVFKQALTKGQGLDAFIFIILGLCPDIVLWSHYKDVVGTGGGEGKGAGRLAETDTVPIYIFKIFMPTCLTLLFLGMGFNGSLWKSFVTVIDAGNVVVTKFTELKLDVYVERLLTRDGTYLFGFDADGSEIGDYKQSVAKEIYKEILKETDNLTYKQRQELGIYVAKVVDSEFGYARVDPNDMKTVTYDANTVLGRIYGFTGKEADIKNLTKNVITNHLEEMPTAAFTISSESLGLKSVSYSEDGSNLNIDPEDERYNTSYGTFYIHVFLGRKNVKPSENYWKMAD